MSIFELNGAGMVAMVGKECVAIAADRRFGVEFQTVTTDAEKVFKIHDRLLLGLTGLQTDMLTFAQKVKFRTNMYKLREERDIRPTVFGNLLVSMLYEKRFGPYFVTPIVAGLEPDNTPFICEYDSIGAINVTTDFVVGGTATEQLLGMCESVWKPNMAYLKLTIPQNADELFETISQCLLNATDRDAYSGWGATVYVITPKGVTVRHLKQRQD